MKISLEGKRPEGEWVSWNEKCGTGDGVTKSFPLPFTIEEARGLLVMRDYVGLAPDSRYQERDADGKIALDEPDGWTLDPATVSVVFDRAPRLSAQVSVSALGRKVGDAFRIYAMDTVLSKKLDEKMPADLRVRKKDAEIRLGSVQESCRQSFVELVSDWTGITDGDGNPLPCDDKNKKLFLDRTDAVLFGLFVTDRSRAIQKERLSGFTAELRD